MSTYSSLKWFAIKRILQFVPLVFVIIIIIFTIIHIAPGDPAYILAGEEASAEYVEQIRQKMGLDRPMPEQLAIYLGNVLHGDLGYSLVYNQPVLNLILERLPATALLLGSSILLSTILGILLGLVSAMRPTSFIDKLISVISIAGRTMPVFWTGQILMLIFAIHLDWFPVQGMFSMRAELVGLEYFLDILSHLFLPMVALTAIQQTLITRLTRTSMLEVSTQDYIILARSKGLSERSVVVKHILRNALLPVVTAIGYNLALVMTGAVLTETVFAWPGLGRLTYTAIYTRDYPLLLGMFIFVSIAVLVANFLTDLLYAFLDPRIRYGRSR